KINNHAKWIEEWMDIYEDDDSDGYFITELPTEPTPPRRMIRARRRVRRVHTNGVLGTGIAGGPGAVPTFGYPIPVIQVQPPTRNSVSIPPQNFDSSSSNGQSITHMQCNRPSDDSFDAKARKILDRCDSQTDLQTLFGFGDGSSSSNNPADSTTNLAVQRESPWNQSTVLFRNPNYTESNMSINISQPHNKIPKLTSLPSTSGTTLTASNDLGIVTPTCSTSGFSTIPTPSSTQFHQPLINPPSHKPSELHFVKPTGQGLHFKALPPTSQPFFDFVRPNPPTVTQNKSRYAGLLASPNINTPTHLLDHIPQQRSSFGPTHFGISMQPTGTTSHTASFQRPESTGLGITMQTLQEPFRPYQGSSQPSQENLHADHEQQEFDTKKQQF
ncbi:hypothetical protein Trydic_g2697, partial [Trypoxylus dichotomus]